MKKMQGFVLWSAGVLLCVSCSKTDISKKDTGNADTKESFAAGSVGDCSSLEASMEQMTTDARFDGVDILVTVDNSASMAKAQDLLSNGLFTLIGTLTRPLHDDADWTWTYPAMDNVRLAVVSSDLGLSYGETRETALSPTGIPGCEAPRGDDGAFRTTPADVATIQLEDGLVRCEASDGEGGDGRCPPQFTCGDIDPETHIGVCRAPDGNTTVNCAPINDTFASTAVESVNSDLAVQAACMVEQGTSGCEFEQQLEAAVVGLEKHRNFIVDTHLLAVLAVSDEEDGSLATPGLFETAAWNDPALRNMAANANPENASHLFSPDRYRQKFTEMKNGHSEAVVFAAVVGVPTRAESAANGWATCEGTGAEIAACLTNNPAMTLNAVESLDSAGNPYSHFSPSCVLENATNGTPVIEASPGRRFVEVAQSMSDAGFVYSICNSDWSPVMTAVAKRIARRRRFFCLSQEPNWVQSAPQPPACLNGDCGETPCEVLVQIPRAPDGSEECPAALYAGLSDDERQEYLDKKTVEPLKNENGTVMMKNIYCAVPQLKVPKDCVAAHEMERTAYRNLAGWYSCENEVEETEPMFEEPDEAQCSRSFRLTALGTTLISGYFFKVQCLKQDTLSATECRAPENAALGAACTQPGMEADETFYSSSNAANIDIISFQNDCDCITHRFVIDMSSPPAVSNFCSRPCSLEDNDCPMGFTCEQVLSPVFDLPEAVSEAYCVPDCLARETECFRTGERCVPTSEKGDVWTCQTEW